MSTTVQSIISLLLVTYLCLLEESRASSMMTHPQNLFCNADYVFKFKAMAMPAEGNMRGTRNPKNQMVKVERIYKGKKMIMPMMKLFRATPIQLGMYQKQFKKNEKCVLFGKMIRYPNNTIMPPNAQKMMSDMGNTISESSITRIINRGLRKKYSKVCSQGCRVKVIYRPTTRSPEHRLKFCDWNINEFRPPRTDCCKTTQFCQRGKDGYCQWKVTRDYKKCVEDNKMP